MGETLVDSQFLAGLEDTNAVGRYKIIRKLGQGSTAVVYLGWDPYIKRYVAIKISQPASEKAKRRFFVEAQSAGRLNHHNIVSVYDAGVYRDYCYITLEYVEGPTLQGFCHKDNLFPLHRAAEIVFNVCNALDYAHSHGIIHRDVKPSNIMIEKDDVTKLSDFGIALMLEHTSEMGMWGTPRYMAPEQLKEEEVVKASDIFSLGCVLYELITGIPAFEGENNYSIMYKIVNEEPAPMKALRPGVPDILEQITRKAVCKDLNGRYHSCMDFAYDLRLALRGLTETAPNKRIKDRLDFIHHVPFFHNFTRKQLEKLNLAGSIVKIKKGNIIMTEGELDDTFYVILSGKVQILKDDKEIALIGLGECFGEMAYISGQPRVATVQAKTDCIVMRISATLLDGAEKPIQLLFFKNFSRILARRLLRTYET